MSTVVAPSNRTTKTARPRPSRPAAADAYKVQANTDPGVYTPRAGKAANPVVGSPGPVPRLTADDSTSRPSPHYLGDEAAFFKETRRVMEQARKGDILCLQMYEFQNDAVNGNKTDAKDSPGFEDQQALLPAIIDAAKRGVKVNIILDASRNDKAEVTNQPLVDYLNKAAGKTGNLTVDYYPAGEVNIDHAKQLVYLSKNKDGSYQVDEAIGGGSNYGNHTAANNDGGLAVYGIDGVESAKIFFQNQAHCRGQQVQVDAPEVPADSPVHWVETSPESTGILDAMLGFLRQSDSVWMQQFVLTQRDVSKQLLRMGPQAHTLFDSGESQYDMKNFTYMADRRVDAKWGDIPNGGKLHRKEAVYLKGGQILGATIGSANATNAGLVKPYDSTWDGKTTHRLTNHEIDAAVTNYTSPDGKYSTLPLLQAMLAKAKANMAQGLDKPAAGSGDSGVF